jgi:hypothetical protein
MFFYPIDKTINIGHVNKVCDSITQIQNSYWLCHPAKIYFLYLMKLEYLSQDSD